MPRKISLPIHYKHRKVLYTYDHPEISIHPSIPSTCRFKCSLYHSMVIYNNSIPSNTKQFQH